MLNVFLEAREQAQMLVAMFVWQSVNLANSDRVDIVE